MKKKKLSSKKKLCDPKLDQTYLIAWIAGWDDENIITKVQRNAQKQYVFRFRNRLCWRSDRGMSFYLWESGACIVFYILYHTVLDISKADCYRQASAKRGSRLLVSSSFSNRIRRYGCVANNGTGDGQIEIWISCLNDGSTCKPTGNKTWRAFGPHSLRDMGYHSRMERLDRSLFLWLRSSAHDWFKSININGLWSILCCKTGDLLTEGKYPTWICPSSDHVVRQQWLPHGSTVQLSQTETLLPGYYSNVRRFLPQEVGRLIEV
jgi:hypothetical protein